MGKSVLKTKRRTSRPDPRYKEPKKPNLVIISKWGRVEKSHTWTNWKEYRKHIPDGLEGWYKDFLEHNSIDTRNYERRSGHSSRWQASGRKKRSRYDYVYSVSNDVNTTFKTLLKLNEESQQAIAKQYKPDEYFAIKKFANAAAKLIGTSY